MNDYLMGKSLACYFWDKSGAVCDQTLVLRLEPLYYIFCVIYGWTVMQLVKQWQPRSHMQQIRAWQCLPTKWCGSILPPATGCAVTPQLHASLFNYGMVGARNYESQE